MQFNSGLPIRFISAIQTSPVSLDHFLYADFFAVAILFSFFLRSFLTSTPKNLRTVQIWYCESCDANFSKCGLFDCGRLVIACSVVVKDFSVASAKCLAGQS